jgi:hydrogenase large subunit
VHFYHLSALDWVDVVSATKADPAKAAALAESISSWSRQQQGRIHQGQGQDQGLRRHRASSASSPTVTGVTRR